LIFYRSGREKRSGGRNRPERGRVYYDLWKEKGTNFKKKGGFWGVLNDSIID